jgi:predicted MFS family arabinose efflux permease
MLAGESWRSAWLLFAVAAALAAGWALAVLPVGQGTAPGSTVRLRPGWFVCPRSSPLLTGALLIGLASSTYWTFAVAHLQGQGGLSTGQSRIVLAVVGLSSIAGAASADVARRLGARAAFILAAMAEAVSLALLGLAPGTLAVALSSAVLFGAAYNTAIAVQVIWSAQVFAARPSAGVAALMVMGALGLLIGPPILGAVADRTGLTTIFLAGAALLVLTTALAPRGQDTPS